MRYNPALDGLRAIAVAVVFGFHVGAPGFAGGFLGVDVFFVLSGFLITRILGEEQRSAGTIQLLPFYAKRLLRLYPALLLVVAAYLAAGSRWFGHDINHGRDALIASLYLSDYGNAYFNSPVVLIHTWSLSVEEHFYLLWPLVLLAALRMSRPGQLATFGLLFVLATLWRWDVVDSGNDWRIAYYSFDTRLSGLFLGGFLAVWRPQSGPKASLATGLAGLAAIAVAVGFSGWREYPSLKGWMLLAELGSAAAVYGACQIKLLTRPALVWPGRMSYGIYLWHYPIVYWLRDQYWDWPQMLATAGALSVAAAAASFYLIERPCIQAGRRWLARHDGAHAVEGSRASKVG
ncbi:MAG TPA: acyltransferase [Stenotrophomonas sp.]|nr:acyltransferase [Stenotrophomonas sp.]